MVSRLVLISLLVTGCDQLFGIGFSGPPGAPPDAGVDAPPPPCSQMSLLADNFTDGTLARLWPTLEGDTPPYEILGSVQMTMPAHGALAYTSMAAARYYDLRESQFEIEIGDSGIADGNYTLVLQAQDPGSGLRIVRTTSMLSFEKIENSVPIALAQLGLSVGAPPPYWRISNANDVTTWATSMDGVTYTTQAQAMGLAYVTFMTPVITANAAALDYKVTIDEVNSGIPTGAACPASQLRDDFSAPALDLQWARTASTGGTIGPMNGQLAMTTSANQPVDLTFAPSTIYDLREGAFAIEVPEAPGDPALNMTFSIATLDGSSADIVETGGVLHTHENGGLLDSFRYYPGYWWRLRYTGNVLYWEISPDGVTYTSLTQDNDLVGLDQVDVAISITGTTSVPATAFVDNFDLPPVVDAVRDGDHHPSR